MTKYDEGVNMSSDYETKEQSPTSAQTKYLGIKDNHEPSAGHLDHVEGRVAASNPMSRAMEMVSRHNERGEHSPMVGGYKMHDGGMRDGCHAEHMSGDAGTEGE